MDSWKTDEHVTRIWFDVETALTTSWSLSVCREQRRVQVRQVNEALRHSQFKFIFLVVLETGQLIDGWMDG